MADFNAFPAMNIKGPDIGPGLDIGNVFANVEKVRSLRNQNSLFPLQQQAMEQQNQLGQFAVQQAQQADKYSKVVRALRSIDDDDPVAAMEQWNNAFSELGPEGKQWIGKYGLDKKDTALKTYQGLGMQAGTKAQTAAQVGSLLGGVGGQNAFQPTDSQTHDIGQMKPEQIQALVQKANYASAEAEKLAKSSNPAQAWKDLQESDPEFKAQHPGEYRADEARQIIQDVRAKKQYIDQLSGNSQLGIPQPRDKLQGINVGGGVFGTFDPYGGFKETYRAPETEHEKAEDAARREELANQRERTRLEYGSDKFDEPKLIEVPDGKGGTNQVTAQQNKKTGQWVSADEKRSPISGDNLRIIGNNGIPGGGRTAGQVIRITTAAHDLATELENISELPKGANSGLLPKAGLEGTPLGALSRAVTSQAAQSYKVSAVGLSRALASLETAGLAPPGSLTGQMEGLQIQAGDSPITVMQKMAAMRQMGENGIDAIVASPLLSSDQEKDVLKIKDRLSKAIPWSQQDVIHLMNSGDSKATLSSIAKQRLNIQEGKIPTVQSAAEAAKLPPGTEFMTPDGRHLRVPNK